MRAFQKNSPSSVLEISLIFGIPVLLHEFLRSDFFRFLVFIISGSRVLFSSLSFMKNSILESSVDDSGIG